MAEKKPDPISRIDSELSEYEAELSGDLEALKRNERQVRERLRQVKAMRRAGGIGNTEGERPKLPGPKKEEVIRLAASILEARPLSEDELKSKVADKLREDHVLTGLPLRMKEALSTDLFETDSTGLVRLNESAPKRSDETKS